MKFLLRARALSIDICAVCTYAGGVRGAAALYRVGRDCTSFGQTGAVSFFIPEWRFYGGRDGQSVSLWKRPSLSR